MKSVFKHLFIFVLSFACLALVTSGMVYLSKDTTYNTALSILIYIVLMWVLFVIYYSNKFGNWCFSRINDFYNLKPEEYNNNAREAFAKSLIDLSSALAKGVTYVVLLLPITVILKDALENSGTSTIVISLDLPWAFVVMLGLVFTLSIMFRQIGLRHLHEIEEKNELK